MAASAATVGKAWAAAGGAAADGGPSGQRRRPWEGLDGGRRSRSRQSAPASRGDREHVQTPPPAHSAHLNRRQPHPIRAYFNMLTGGGGCPCSQQSCPPPSPVSNICPLLLASSPRSTMFFYLSFIFFAVLSSPMIDIFSKLPPQSNFIKIGPASYLHPS